MEFFIVLVWAVNVLMAMYLALGMKYEFRHNRTVKVVVPPRIRRVWDMVQVAFFGALREAVKWAWTLKK